MGQPALKCRFLEKHKMHFKSEGLKKKKKKKQFSTGGVEIGLITVKGAPWECR